MKNSAPKAYSAPQKPEVVATVAAAQNSSFQIYSNDGAANYASGVPG